MKLWEFSDDVRDVIVAAHFSHIGKIVEKFSTPYSYIYTLQSNYSSDQYLIAKAPKIDSQLSDDEIKNRLIRFLSEISHVHNVCHHSLIARFGRGEVIHGCPFIFSPKKHATLSDLIEEPKLEEVDVLVIAIQIVSALEYCGAKGIFAHQDLKPDNIFIDFIHKKFVTNGDYPFKYQAYLADLGMANAALLFHKPYGSRPYMAPEQYRQLSVEYAQTLNSQFIEMLGKSFNKVDIFAVGVILVEMLTGGLHPMGIKTSDVWPSVTGKWSHEEVWKRWSKSDNKIGPNISIPNEQLLLLIKSCLSTDPNNRPDATALKSSLFNMLIDYPDAYSTLNLYLSQLDQAEAVNSSAGWPYMDELVEKLSSF